jgi:hypothetical protein
MEVDDDSSRKKRKLNSDRNAVAPVLQGSKAQHLATNDRVETPQRGKSSLGAVPIEQLGLKVVGNVPQDCRVE